MTNKKWHPIPEKWLSYAEASSQRYSKLFIDSSELRGPEFTRNTPGRLAASHVRLDLGRIPYRKWGSALEEIIKERTFELFVMREKKYEK